MPVCWLARPAGWQAGRRGRERRQTGMQAGGRHAGKQAGWGGRGGGRAPLCHAAGAAAPGAGLPGSARPPPPRWRMPGWRAAGACRAPPPPAAAAQAQAQEGLLALQPEACSFAAETLGNKKQWGQVASRSNRDHLSALPAAMHVTIPCGTMQYHAAPAAAPPAPARSIQRWPAAGRRLQARGAPTWQPAEHKQHGSHRQSQKAAASRCRQAAAGKVSGRCHHNRHAPPTANRVTFWAGLRKFHCRQYRMEKASSTTVVPPAACWVYRALNQLS